MAAVPAPQAGTYPTPSASQTPAPGRPNDSSYYLREGLEGVEHQRYGDLLLFTEAIESQAEKLRLGNAGQYAVFSPVTEDELVDINDFRDTHHKGLRFMYLNNEQALIVKIMPGAAHEMANGSLAIAFWIKAHAMGVNQALGPINSKRFRGIGGQKEADAAVKPLLYRPLETDWPTLVIECGVTESLKHLRAVAHWWLEKSMRDVKIVLLVSVSKAARTIHLEQWEMFTVQSQLSTRSSSHPPIIKPTKIRTVNIVGPVPAPVIPQPAVSAPAGPVPAGPVPAPAPVATGGPLTLNFDKIFLRQPLAAQGEGDIIFTTQDLQNYASQVWGGAQ
ncbi:hypothetical protein HOY82DRAFT_628697 [Tuber indicum]|nr:hypothetical protein HOY82DRAFT_628697 [Tuber indicum]